ncbi:glycosyltransferase family 4 protein [Mycobacterium barrassiae]|uniref:glycosyltransferase family 4 protein n=1 Tax=Mycobacterium barrassiae TaxID=319709 RepID=UPI003556C2DD|nr:glycosyltransferase family 4 protein [Mycobacterium barrassiae]
MSKRPILLVEFSPSGGLFQFAMQLGDALAATGEQVELLTGPEPELSATQPGFTVRPVLPTWHPKDGADGAPTSRVLRVTRRGWRAAKLMLAWVVLGWYLVRIRPLAVLWSHWRFSFEPLFVVLIAAVLRNVTLGIVAHEPLPRSDAKNTSRPKSGRFFSFAFGAAWRRMDVAFTLGPQTRNLVLEHWRPRGEVVVIPHGDERVLGVGPAAARVADTAPVALFFGTWSTRKGIHVLLEAFALVLKSLPEARLILAGAVDAAVDLDALLARADEIGNIDARPGYVAVDEVSSLFSSVRLVVTPYLQAAQSGVAHLAYTFARPVVATAIGDIPQVVKDGKTGLLVRPNNREELADAMLVLLRDAQRADDMGAAGQRSVAGAWETAAMRVSEALGRCRPSVPESK